MYAVYHGPDGLKEIAKNIHNLTFKLAKGLKQLGYQIGVESFFDTVRINLGADSPVKSAKEIIDTAENVGINLRTLDEQTVCISLDETTTDTDVQNLWQIFAGEKKLPDNKNISPFYESSYARTSSYLTHPVFNSYHSETELLRYIHRLQSKI